MTTMKIGAETWYLLKTKARQEKRAIENLKRQHVKCYCPEISVEKILRGKKSKIIEILFPGYLFANFEHSAISMKSVNSTRGVKNFVSFGGNPARVPSALIQELREKIEYTENVVISNLPKRGDKLKVINGPFNGMSVIFFQPDGDKRAEVLINMMDHQVKASIQYSRLVTIT